MSTFYEHKSKRSGDGLATTDWNELSNAVAGNQGLHLALDTDYKVGIGTTSVSSGVKLEVNGNTHIDGTLGVTGIATLSSSLIVNGSGDHSFMGCVGIGTKDPGAKLSVFGGTARAGGSASKYTEIGHDGSAGFINTVGAHNIDFRHDNMTNMSIRSNGRLGIGTTSPRVELEVIGTVKATGFEGDGAALTNLNASNINGTISEDCLPEGSLTEDKEYDIGHYEELGGFVFMRTADKKHGLVAARTDQHTTQTRNWWDAHEVISNPSNYSTDKFRDWRLPTVYETGKMQLHKDEIGGFDNAYYWTSTEDNNEKAKARSFGDSPNVHDYDKSSYLRVRAVRAF